jgi:hypothetical protein
VENISIPEYDVLNNIQTIPVILPSKVDHSPAKKDQDFIEKRGEAKGFMLGFLVGVLSIG